MLFILLATLTDAGLDATVSEPDLFASACAELEVPGVRLLARYATLEVYDFVAVAEAKVHIESLHAVSAHLLAKPSAESVIRVGESEDWDILSSPLG